MMSDCGPISQVRVAAYTIPTTTFGEPMPESDGTATWDSTTILIVELDADGETGLGYAYTSSAAVAVVRDQLAPVLLGTDPDAVTGAFWQMARAVRNLGWNGIAASALSASDIAVHDLRARRIGRSMVDVLGQCRESVLAYGSGGFTNYSEQTTTRQLREWIDRGMRAVKIKIGRHPEADPGRVEAARAEIGDDIDLLVDANGALQRAQALGMAEVLRSEGQVSWFEEPVSSDDLDGLRFLRDRAPGGLAIAAGEYVYTPSGFRAVLERGSVDVLQADATRCGGVTGFLNAAAQCTAAGIPLSAHTAPALHTILGCVTEPTIHVESFHDHELIEARLFNGVAPLVDGRLVPDRSRPGHGLTLRSDIDLRPVERWRS